MRKYVSLLAAALLVLAAIAGCAREDEYTAEDAFNFPVYPGARYLGNLTELTKQAHRTMNPTQEPPPTAIYEAEASLEEVAAWYAKEYGYGEVAAESTNTAGPMAPKAYFRTGDLGEARQVEELTKKMNLTVDYSPASGPYAGAHIEGKRNRPRVDLQRPYFDMTTSKVVDRTLILMSR